MSELYKGKYFFGCMMLIVGLTDDLYIDDRAQLSIDFREFLFFHIFSQITYKDTGFIQATAGATDTIRIVSI
jgi:hypothetical protein